MAALLRLFFMMVLVLMIVIFVFLERTFVCIQSLIDDNLDFRRLGVGMVVVFDLENQSRFAFFESFEVESPASFPFDIENFLVADFPTERMLIVVRACNFFLVLVEEFHMNVCAHAIGIDFEAREFRNFLAAVNTVECISRLFAGRDVN